MQYRDTCYARCWYVQVCSHEACLVGWLKNHIRIPAKISSLNSYLPRSTTSFVRHPALHTIWLVRMLLGLIYLTGILDQKRAATNLMSSSSCWIVLKTSSRLLASVLPPPVPRRSSSLSSPSSSPRFLPAVVRFLVDLVLVSRPWAPPPALPPAAFFRRSSFLSPRSSSSSSLHSRREDRYTSIHTTWRLKL